MLNNIRCMTKNEKLLLKVLLGNIKEKYRNINFIYSNTIINWGDSSGSFDFVYETKIDPKNNRSTNISKVYFYDVDKIICEVILLAYIDKQYLYCIDILKLGENDLIQLPTNEREFFI
ncbi:hypothetical protein LMG7974_01949 [Campylobacter majalis]|uniref:DUF6984 domain-containing protein n=1 Tax=Campylobacter majalis TaxID=2790656 RepID=A0ABM8QAI0_9BACT|nr:hypothetical protein LMG7974_01949 [Campylobacter majalis]